MFQTVKVHGDYGDGKSRSYDVYDINGYSFTNEPATGPFALPDGDIINIPFNSVQRNPYAGWTFVLQTPPNFYWKAIDFVEPGTFQIIPGTHIEVNGGGVSAWTRIDPSAPHLLLFGKGKFLNAHTPMYLLSPFEIVNAQHADLRGYAFTFDWVHDNG